MNPGPRCRKHKIFLSHLEGGHVYCKKCGGGNGPRCRHDGWFLTPRKDGGRYCKKCARAYRIANHAAKKGAVMPGGRPRTKTADPIAAQVREIMRRADRNTSAHQEAIDVRQSANEAEIEKHAAEHEAMIAQIRAE